MKKETFTGVSSVIEEVRSTKPCELPCKTRFSEATLVCAKFVELGRVVWQNLLAIVQSLVTR